ncbi:MAG: rod shape-determining protein MreC [Hymenobacter sp.]
MTRLLPPGEPEPAAGWPKTPRLRQQLTLPDAGRREGRLAWPCRSARTGDTPAPAMRYHAGPAHAAPDTLLAGPAAACRPATPSYPLIPARVINNIAAQRGQLPYPERGQPPTACSPAWACWRPAGVVGRMKVVTEHYATVTSLLHSKTSVSAKIKRDGTFGTIRWLGDDPTHALLDNVPRQNQAGAGRHRGDFGLQRRVSRGRVHRHRSTSFVKEPDKNFWTVRGAAGRRFHQPDLRVRGDEPARSAERDTVEARAGAASRKGERPMRASWAFAGAGAALCALRAACTCC